MFNFNQITLIKNALFFWKDNSNEQEVEEIVEKLDQIDAGYEDEF